MSGLASLIGQIWRAPGGVFGLIVVGAILLGAALAPQLAPHGPNAIDAANRLAAPSAAHWLGTDQLGRDLFTRVLFGARTARHLLRDLTVRAVTRGNCEGTASAGQMGDV